MEEYHRVLVSVHYFSSGKKKYGVGNCAWYLSVSHTNGISICPNREISSKPTQWTSYPWRNRVCNLLVTGSIH